MRLLGLMVGIVAALAVGARCSEFEQLVIQNVGFSRVVSGTSNILKTTHLQIGGLEMLDQPSVEFMIEVEQKGETVTLVPSDFSIESIDSSLRNKENQTSIELKSHYWGLPLHIYVDYWHDDKNQYQQKSISIQPCKNAPGTVLKRVTIESFRFKNPILPLAPTAAGFANEAKSSFAAVDPKSGKGLCFDLPSGKARFERGHSLIAYEEANVPIEKGYETGRLAIGVTTGKPEAALSAYRQMLLETRYPSLAKEVKFSALRKRFAACFAVCQCPQADSGDTHIDMEGRVDGNKGFMLIFNSGAEAAKALLPISSPALNLSGELKLSDWTSLERGSDLGTKTKEDKVEIDVPAKGYRIIGVNIDG
jgi:hypothetical protein